MDLNKYIERVVNANETVGLVIKNGEPKVYVPNTLRVEKQRDILCFLSSINLVANNENNILNSGNSTGKFSYPFFSYVWIIKDYVNNGIYFNRDKVYDINKGKIEWKKSMKQTPLYSNGNFIYDNLVTSRNSPVNDTISEIYKICLKTSLDILGWLFNIRLKINIKSNFSVNEMINIINKENSRTFDDLKNTRFKHMLYILSHKSFDNKSDINYFATTDSYYYAYEKMINLFFSGVNKKSKYNPFGYWVLNGTNDKLSASQLRPDTIIENDDSIYILDAKMYKFGSTKDVGDLPETSSIQKQITYGDFISKYSKNKKIRNAFIIPYDKYNELFYYDKNLEPIDNKRNIIYIGYSSAEWRETSKFKNDYDNIYTFLIDFNYLINNYMKKESEEINEMCNFIDECVNNND